MLLFTDWLGQHKLIPPSQTDNCKLKLNFTLSKEVETKLSLIIRLGGLGANSLTVKWDMLLRRSNSEWKDKKNWGSKSCVVWFDVWALLNFKPSLKLVFFSKLNLTQLYFKGHREFKLIKYIWVVTLLLKSALQTSQYICLMHLYTFIHTVFIRYVMEQDSSLVSVQYQPILINYALGNKSFKFCSPFVDSYSPTLLPS